MRRAARTARWALVVARRAFAAARVLPPRIAFFYVRALLSATFRRDEWTLVSATRPADLAKLLELADGRAKVAEIGSGPGWSALALALADPSRRVVSFDVDERPVNTYARLVPASVRQRVQFVLASGAEGASDAPNADFVFIDSSHEYAETLETFAAWRPKLLPGAMVVFHDYGNPQYPGVAEAVAELGLDGTVDGEVFVWISD
ncbi:MAG: hypothetical protein QOJ29_3574 [Thermoleophilaceae bacterium]|nr:hypothetical protein [Thermoleophilaceae bacterium]